jgi:hypothetical protein
MTRRLVSILGRLPDVISNDFREGKGMWYQPSLTLELPGRLYAELKRAAKIAGCSPTTFASEAVESVLASRRLPRVKMDVEIVDDRMRPVPRRPPVKRGVEVPST